MNQNDFVLKACVRYSIGMRTLGAILGQCLSSILFCIGGLSLALWAAAAIIALVSVLGAAIVAAIPLILAHVLKAWVDGRTTRAALGNMKQSMQRLFEAANDQ